MSTHFRPRATTPGPPSPTRPSTARSTIRAISPSPPPSVSEALRLDLATNGTPKFDSRSTPGSVRIRPKSDDFHQAYVHGFGTEETEFAKYVATAENGNLGSSPADITANVTVRRGGGIVARRSSAKRGARSRSPKKRPQSTPTELSLHREMTLRGQQQETVTSPQNDEVQVGDDIDSDTYADCPDTPTPMTNSQKRSAYLPLGTPTPFPSTERSSNSQSKSRLLTPIPATTPTPPTPRLEFFESFHEQPSYDSGSFDTNYPQTYLGPRGKLKGSESQTEWREVRQGVKARTEARERMAVGSDTGYSSSAYLPRILAYQSEQSTNDGMTMQRPELEPSAHPRMHLAPPQQALDTTFRKAVPGATSDLARHVSISEVSHVSGGTVTSKRSIFSTPSRDELERKKALVEEDDGPFAKAVSMVDLNARRRVVGEEAAGGDRGTGILEAEGRQRKKKSRNCGLVVGCNVM